MKGFLPLSMFVFSVSCDYPFFNDQKTEATVVAVSAFITDDSVFRVEVEPVADAFSTQTKTLSVEKVKVINRTTSEEFLLQPESDSSLVYTSADVIPQPGEVFTVEVYVVGANHPVTATDTVPKEKPGFRLVSTGVTASTDEAILLRSSAIFRFLPNKAKAVSYYEFFVMVTIYGSKWGKNNSPTAKQVLYLESTTSLITEEDYYPSNPVTNELGPPSLVFKCNGMTDSATIDFSYLTNLASDKDSIYTCYLDLNIQLREVSFSYYKYMTSLYCQYYAIDGNYIYGMTAPVTVYSNVENGTGIVAAFNSVSQTYYLKSKGYPK